MSALTRSQPAPTQAPGRAEMPPRATKAGAAAGAGLAARGCPQLGQNCTSVFICVPQLWQNMGRMIPSRGQNQKHGQKRSAGGSPPGMAENHQGRCNPAIRTAIGAITINHLGMAKNMHIRRSTSTRQQTMTRLRLITINLFAGTALLLAQDPQTGGWRRFNDPPAPQAPQAAPVVQDQDPSQPVARADAYGQPQQPQQQTQPQQTQQQPQLQQQRNDRPPAAVPHYGLPSAVTIRPGTFLTVRVNQKLSSDHNQQGDIFNATLAQPIVVDGVVVAQRGQPVMGRVAEAAKRVSGSSRLGLQLTGLTLADGTQANVQSQLINRNGQISVGRDAGASEAVGSGGVLVTRGHRTVVDPEAILTFRVDTPVNVDLTRAPPAFRYVGPDEYDRGVQTTVARRPAATRPYYSPYPYYYGGYPGYYPYAWGPSFGIGIGIRGGGWGRRW